MTGSEPETSGIPQPPVPREREQIVRGWLRPVESGGQSLVLEAEDGTCWQLGHDGLCSAGVSTVAPDWTPSEPVQRFLPASIVSRPKGSAPWNYRLHFSTGALLTVSMNADGPPFRWTIQKLKPRQQ